MGLKNYLEKYGIYEYGDFKYIQVNEIDTTYICDIYGNIYNTRRKGNGYIKTVFKKLEPIKLPNGYYAITLSINGVTKREYIHRIVAKTFIDIPEKYKNDGYTMNTLEVNHKDGDKSNNIVDNLEWATDSDNKIHGYNTSLYKQGEDSCKSIYTNEQIHAVCKYIEENILSPSEISKKTGVSVGQIADIRNYASWKSISNLYDFSNYKPKQQKYTDEQISECIKLLDKGFKPSYISKCIGMNIKTVYMYRSKINKNL